MTEQKADPFKKRRVRIDGGRRRLLGEGVAAEIARRNKELLKGYRALEAPPPPPPPPKRPRGRPKKERPEVPKHLATKKITIDHEWGKQRVDARQTIIGLLRRVRVEEGEHARLFVADWEMIGASLRSVDFESSASGSGENQFPIARIDAARRLNEIRNLIGRVNYDLLEGYLCRGLSIEDMASAMEMRGSSVTSMLQLSIQQLANFYTPQKTRRNRAHEQLVQLIRLAEREVSR